MSGEVKQKLRGRKKNRICGYVLRRITAALEQI